MTDQLVIGSWNLCLGLANKKDLVINQLKNQNIAICGLQETEIQKDFPENVLNCGNYNAELELNKNKKRVGFYIRNDINYTRRNDLETEGYHVIIIDIHSDDNLRLINLYRPFRPPGLISPNDFFKVQLNIVKSALKNDCIVMGDFNLDARMDHRPDYHHKVPLTFLSEFALNQGLSQIINFST